LASRKRPWLQDSMSNAPRTTSRPLDAMAGVFADVKAKLAELGLNMTVWDAEMNCVVPWTPSCDLCQVLCGTGNRCESPLRQLAEQIIATKTRATGRTPLGGCVIGIPIMHRRRLLGAAVACFPVVELLDNEGLHRLCDKLELDWQTVDAYARNECRHSVRQADDFLKMFEWLMTHVQAERTARGELATLSTNLSNTYEELSLLYSISRSMQVTRGPGAFLEEVCTDLLEVVNTPIAAVLYPHRQAEGENTVVMVGQGEVTAEEIDALSRTRLTDAVTQARGVVVYNNFVMRADMADMPPIWNLVGVPINTDSDEIGMLVAFNKADDFDTADLKLLSSIASQAAVFLANSRLYADLQELLTGVLHALTNTIDAKDPYTCGHSQRVAVISRRIAIDHGLPPERIQRIYLMGLLHDIGKIGVPEAVLRKEGRLTDEEFEHIKRHPGLGAKILEGIRQLEDVIPGIISHHERLNGRGYPAGLAGDEIPFEALIVGLADGFDAMTSDRTYRKALSLDVVIEEIRKCAGTQFHQGLVDTFLAMDLPAFLDELRSPKRTFIPIEFTREQKR